MTEDEELDALLALRAALVQPVLDPLPDDELDTLLALRGELVTPPPPERETRRRWDRRIWLALAASVCLMAGGVWWSQRPPTPTTPTAAQQRWWLETAAGQPQQPPFRHGQRLTAVVQHAPESGRYVYLLHRQGDDGQILYEGPLPAADAEGKRRIDAQPLEFTADAQPAEETLALVISDEPLAAPLQTLVGVMGPAQPKVTVMRMRFTVAPAP